jgi:hypothetical protein
VVAGMTAATPVAGSAASADSNRTVRMRINAGIGGNRAVKWGPEWPAAYRKQLNR